MQPTDRAWRRPVARTLTLAWLESLTIRRDPVILAMILVIPTLQIALFGYAIRPLSGEVPVALARVETDPALVNLLRDSGVFRVAADGLTRDAALARLRAQDALIAVVIPPPPPQDQPAPAADDGAVQVFVDDSDPVRTDPALSKLEALYWRRAAEGDPFRPPEVLSGLLFPVASMPGWAQRLGALFPLTYYVEVARGVTLRGADAGFVHARTWPVAAVAAGALLAAVGTFRRQRP